MSETTHPHGTEPSLLDQAVDLYRQGQLPQALQRARQGLQEQPTHHGLLYVAGAAARGLGQFAEAERYWRAAIAAHPAFASGYAHLGALLHQGGRLEEAEAAYRQALAIRPTLADAHYSLGILLKERGRAPEAEAAYRQALAIRPDYVEALNNLGNLLRELGRLDEAEVLLRRALAISPGTAPLYGNLGALLQTCGRLAEAEASYRHALVIQPHYAEGHNDLGILLRECGRLDEAEVAFRQALAIHPRYPQAHCNLANLLAACGRADEAEAAYHQALAVQPRYVDALNNLGVLLKERGRLNEAQTVYRQALAIAPDSAEIHNNLGNVLRKCGRLDQAEVVFRRALDLQPGYAEALCNLGILLQERGCLSAAEAALRQTLAIRPHFAEAHQARGVLLIELGRLDEALAAFRQAVECRPDYPEALSRLLHCRRHVCDWHELSRHEAQVRAFVQAGVGMVTPFSFLASHAAPAEQLACARQWVRKSAVVDAGPGFVHAPTRRHARIRLGYLSADFHTHATAYLAAELFERHDRDRFDVFAYSFGPNDGSAMRARLERAFDRFVDIRAFSYAEAAARIHADAVDILIDLKGYTQDSRPAILAHRPAPIQVNYLGFPGTMGAPFIDYLIADAFVAPFEHQAFYDEALVHLPDGYQPNDTQRAIAERTPSRAECGLPEQGLVFCCFNNSFKITPAFFAIWMRLLAQTPGSVLWLLHANATACDNLCREALAHGIDPGRLVFAPRLPLAEHLARHRLADLFLDTLPYNAHTTASDALWAGLPVLTCAGETFAGRVGGSLLHAVGLADLVTTTPAAYEAMALRLAHEPGRLAGIRARLAANRQSAPLFDIGRFTCHLETAYTRMWECYCAGERAAAFAVDANDQCRQPD